MLGLHEKWRATFIESWPDEVCELGLPFEQLLISEQDRAAIGSRTAAFRELFDIDELTQLSDEFRIGIDAKTALFKDGAHFRLGGCSFKQPGRYQDGPIFNSAQLMPHVLRDNPAWRDFLPALFKTNSTSACSYGPGKTYRNGRSSGSS